MHFIKIKNESNWKIPLKDLILYLTCFVHDWQRKLTRALHFLCFLYISIIYWYLEFSILLNSKQFFAHFMTQLDYGVNSQITTPISFSSFIIYFSVLQVYLMTTLHFCLDELIFVKETHIVKLLIKQHVSLLIYMREKGGFWDTLGNQRPNWKEPGN